MHRPVKKLGKVGTTVYGKNRHGQTCYALVIPTNPRTEAQQANRRLFGAQGSGWRHLTDPQRALWEADARHHFTHGRPGQRARLTGFLRYMQVNLPRARQGLPSLDVPPSAFSLSAPPRVPVRYHSAPVVPRLPHRWPRSTPRRPGPRPSGSSWRGEPLVFTG